MLVGFEDLTQFFHKPPKMSEMVFEARDRRRGKTGQALSALPPKRRNSEKNDILIIVPSYHDNYRLKKLLRYLRGQSFRRFDVAIIFAKDDEFVRESKLSLYQVKRKLDLGFAGSVYLGQLLALQEGYKYFLFTDVDRVPHSKGVLRSLYNAAEKENSDYVFGNNLVKGYFLHSGRFFEFRRPRAVRSNCVFGLIRTDVLWKTGLYALPFYTGYEDVEFEYRLQKAVRKKTYLDTVIYESYLSPAKYPFLRNFGGDTSGNMYVYPTMIGIYNCPQTANRMGFVRKASTFFFMLLAQKFSALRVPALAAYERNAKKCVFAKAYGSGMSSEIIKADSDTGFTEDYESYTSNAPFRNIGKILRATFSHVEKFRTTNFSPLFDFFLHDSMYVYDEQKGRDFLFVWRKKPSMPQKLFALLSALYEAKLAVLKSEYYELAGDWGIFHGYGLKAVKMNISKRDR